MDLDIPFLSLFRSREVTGMDIGTSGIKMLRFVRKGNKRKVNEPSESILQWYYPGHGDQWDQEIPALREFLKANGLAGASVACNIEDPSLKLRRVELPKMPDNDLKEAVPWQMRETLEGQVADYVIRYTPLERMEMSADPAKALTLLVYAVKKAAVRRVVEFAKKLSLNPIAVEPTSVSLLAAFDRLHGWTKGEFYALVDFGESKSIFTVMGEGRLYFSRPLADITCGHLKQPDFYTKSAVEIQKSLDAFFLMFRKEKVDRLFLCGGGAALPGLKESLAENLAVETELLDTLEKLEMPAGPPHLFGAALGLALHV